MTEVTLFSFAQKSEFKDEATVHSLLICRLPKLSSFLGAEVLVAVKIKLWVLLL